MVKAYDHDYYYDPRSAFTGRTTNLYNCPVYEGKRYGEDVEFCRKWKMLGGKIFVEPQIQFSHAGYNLTEGCYMDELNKMKTAARFNAVEVAA
jgi:hypothetical protein